jgi:hypothetical protein
VSEVQMPVLLSLTALGGHLWGIGPAGLFRLDGDVLTVFPQPMAQPLCCAAAGARLLVGGAPLGLAYTARADTGEGWQAAWLDGVTSAVVSLAADPREAESGVLLAGTAGDGVLRSEDHGATWTVCNFGLEDFEVLCLGWAPPMPPGQWPRREVVFAGTAGGLYRSPNGGRGWRRCAGIAGAVLSVAAAHDVHTSGAVLAGTEERGLWRSRDGGHSFAPVAGTPATVNAVLATPGGWLLSDLDGIWRSNDGETWSLVAGAEPALCLITDGGQVIAGGAAGIARLR